MFLRALFFSSCFFVSSIVASWKKKRKERYVSVIVKPEPAPETCSFLFLLRRKSQIRSYFYWILLPFFNQNFVYRLENLSANIFCKSVDEVQAVQMGNEEFVLLLAILTCDSSEYFFLIWIKWLNSDSRMYCIFQMISSSFEH